MPLLYVKLDDGHKSSIFKAYTEWTTQRLYDEVDKMIGAQQVYNKAAEKMGIGKYAFCLAAQGKPMDAMEKLICNYHFTTHDTIDFVHRNEGGSKLQPLPGFVALTDEPCCIMCDDNPDEKRAEMPCGCALAADTVKYHVDDILRKGDSKFSCPKCEAQWEFFVVAHVLSAVVNDDDLNKYKAKVNANYRDQPKQDIRQCGMCKAYCTRDMTKTWRNYNRVTCNNCHVDFCWICGDQWRGDVTGPCGNTRCNKIIEDRLKLLDGCATKTIDSVSGVPEIRACPQCGALISHTKACKHMECISCKCSFCFVCLKLKGSNGNWQCGGAFSSCPVAPRQKSLSTGAGYGGTTSCGQSSSGSSGCFVQ